MPVLRLKPESVLLCAEDQEECGDGDDEEGRGNGDAGQEREAESRPPSGLDDHRRGRNDGAPVGQPGVDCDLSVLHFAFGLLEGDTILLGGFSFTFVVIYFNAAVVGATLQALRGENPSVGSGLRAANRRLGSIIGWSLFASTIGLQPWRGDD